MDPAIVFIGRLCGELAAKAQIAAAAPGLAGITPLAAKVQTDKLLLDRAWSDMAIRNLLADMLRTVTRMKAMLGVLPPLPPLPGQGLNLSGAAMVTCRAICNELLPRLETALADHSPSRAHYTRVLCLGYKVAVPGGTYTGGIDDAADMLAKCDEMKVAIRAAYQLADRDNRKSNNHVNTLKVFVAPEFFFRGRNGAYEHAVVHGGEARTDTQGRTVKVKHRGIADNLRDELEQPQYKHWLFVLGTAIAATQSTRHKCTACAGTIVFARDPRTGLTTPRCNNSQAHRVIEETVGAYVENFGLIYKNGNFHTVSKELVSHLDFVDGADREKITVGGDRLDVVTDVRPSGYKATTNVATAFTDERMGGCIFTIDGITIGVEVCLDHAATTASQNSGRLAHCGNIQLQIIPSWGMKIGSLATIAGGVVFNVDGATPHVEVIGGMSDFRIKSTRFDGYTFRPSSHEAANWAGTDVNALIQLENVGEGSWKKHDRMAPSAPAGPGSIVMYGPFGLPRA